jgi:hypothetical protein
VIDFLSTKNALPLRKKLFFFCVEQLIINDGELFAKTVDIPDYIGDGGDYYKNVIDTILFGMTGLITCVKWADAMQDYK